MYSSLHFAFPAVCLRFADTKKLLMAAMSPTQGAELYGRSDKEWEAAVAILNLALSGVQV